MWLAKSITSGIRINSFRVRRFALVDIDYSTDRLRAPQTAIVALKMLM